MLKKLLNIKETVEYLGVKQQTLYQWASEHRVYFAKIGCMLRFYINDLNKLIE